MTRTAARELAVRLCFAAHLSGEDTAQTVSDFFTQDYFETLAEEDPVFSDYPDEQQMSYIRRLTELVYEHFYELNEKIETYSHGWRLDRISKIAATILRCAMCEILYLDDVPPAAAANEAVELAKKYEEPETAAFVNGILGSFIRDLQSKGEETEPAAQE